MFVAFLPILSFVVFTRVAGLLFDIDHALPNNSSRDCFGSLNIDDFLNHPRLRGWLVYNAGLR